MMKTVGAAVLAGALFTGAPASAAPGGVNSQDVSFLRAAHQSNLAEIAAARIAQRKATVQVTRNLAARWLADHSRLDGSVVSVAHRFHVTLPNRPNAEEQRMAEQYSRQTGRQFDRFWVSTQLTGHGDAEAAGAEELARGSAPAVKELARAAGPVVREHMRLLTAAARQLGIPNQGTGQAQRPGAQPARPGGHH